MVRIHPKKSVYWLQITFDFKQHRNLATIIRVAALIATTMSKGNILVSYLKEQVHKNTTVLEIGIPAIKYLEAVEMQLVYYTYYEILFYW